MISNVRFRVCRFNNLFYKRILLNKTSIKNKILWCLYFLLSFNDIMIFIKYILINSLKVFWSKIFFQHNETIKSTNLQICNMKFSSTLNKKLMDLISYLNNWSVAFVMYIHVHYNYKAIKWNHFNNSGIVKSIKLSKF